jgi:hypothetical protein
VNTDGQTRNETGWMRLSVTRGDDGVCTLTGRHPLIPGGFEWPVPEEHRAMVERAFANAADGDTREVEVLMGLLNKEIFDAACDILPEVMARHRSGQAPRGLFSVPARGTPHTAAIRPRKES